MDLMQWAAHLSLQSGVGVEGPFGCTERRSVVLWLPNRRAVSLLHRAGIDAPGTVDLVVCRETVAEFGTDYDGATPRRLDYSTPVTNDHRDGMTLDDVREALAVLRDLPEIDPRDQRSTGRPGGRQWTAVHYGESRPACGAALRDDDTCTTVIKDVRCPDCLEAVNRAV